MDYPVNTSLQLRAVLRALRKLRHLNQAALGEILGVNQKRIAHIEGAPGSTSFDQIAKMVTALGGRLLIQAAEVELDSQPSTKRSRKRRNVQHDGW